MLPEMFWINGGISGCMVPYVCRSQFAQGIQLLLLLFPPSFCPPPPLPPSLWQVNKINIHPPVAMAGMSDSLSCHQLRVCVCVCVFVIFDACVRVYFQHSLSLLAGPPPPALSLLYCPFLGSSEPTWGRELV